ncbi:MAG: hypothetical protein P8J32_01290 [bacterium]|nr:hypothetical protein [bacterium]
MKTLATIILTLVSVVCLAQTQVHEFSRFQGETSKGVKYSIWINRPKDGVEIKIQIVEGREIVNTVAEEDKVYSIDKGMEYHYYTPEGLLVLYFDGNRCKTAWWLTDFDTSIMSFKEKMKFSR